MARTQRLAQSVEELGLPAAWADAGWDGNERRGLWVGPRVGLWGTQKHRGRDAGHRAGARPGWPRLSG
jgi:hypothetical protein